MRLHDALRDTEQRTRAGQVKSMVATSGAGILLLRRANLSTQARIAIMTLAGNSLSFSDAER